MLTTAKIRCRGRALAAGALCLLVAILLEVVCWGFTVDDAWIVSRVAARGAATGLYAFNPDGPITDAVTPLGFAHLLGALGRLLSLEEALEFWGLARWLGLIAYAGSFFLAGSWAASERMGRAARFWWLPAGLVGLCLPAAVWAGAGLETALVGLLFLLGARWIERAPKTWGGYFLLGAAPAWRPELLPVALAVAALSAPGGAHFQKFARIGRPSRWLGLVLLLPLLVSLVRLFAFGTFLPLSAQAKEASLESGLFYASVTVIWAGLPWLLLVCRRGGRASPWLWAFAAHLLALVYAGGDWMPALRLTAPLYPWLVWRLGGELDLSWLRVLWLVPAALGPFVLAWEQGADFRAVTERRLSLVKEGMEVLRVAQRVAAVDIGWVGLATEATVVDLAGVTDPSIARLPGGHTSKAIYPGLFSDREVDVWIIRAADTFYKPGDPLELIQSVYAVDARLLQRQADLGFAGTATILLEGTPGQYVVTRRQALATRSGPETSRHF